VIVVVFVVGGGDGGGCGGGGGWCWVVVVRLLLLAYLCPVDVLETVKQQRMLLLRLLALHAEGGLDE
jgi:hypothetical protein